jgi:YVTN family beta-propeller protein
VPFAVAVNPVLNRVYVANNESDDVTIIDGATNSTLTVAAGRWPHSVAVNPVTGRVFVTSNGGDNVAILTEVPDIDTRVRAEFDRLPGDTTALTRPQITGKAVNRWTPNQTSMLGAANRVGTGQLDWNWAEVTGGQGTDSVTWTWNWGDDSLVMGENLLVAVPLEDQAGTTNNLGLGTPCAGNLAVYPVYRVDYFVGREEMVNARFPMTRLPSIVRGMLFLPPAGMTNDQVPMSMLDITGRKVMDLKPGPNDISRLSPGVYFVRRPETGDGRPRTAVRKVVIQH